MVSRLVALREARKIRSRGRRATVIKAPISFGINQFLIRTSSRKRRR